MLTIMFKVLKQKFEEHPFRTTAEILGLFLANVGVAVLIIWMIYLGIVGSGEPPQCSTSAPSTDNVSITGSGGSWTKPGTRNFNGAKALFVALKSKGVNDIQASGVVGALAHEAGGAFSVPDIAQGFYTWTSNPTEENAGISSPGVAAKAERSSGGERLTGASMFQYTPFTKYAPASNKAKWRSYPDLINYWFKTQVPGQGQSISGLKRCDSLASSVHWTLQVEEGGGSSDAFADRLAKAHQAYNAFKGVSGGASDADASAQNSFGAKNCSNSNNTNSADGTGAIKEHVPAWGLHYKPDEVPSDIKQYIHSPSSLGMSYGSGHGWSAPGGECVNLSNSYFHLMYKTSRPFVMGNGIDIAPGWSHVMSGSLSHTPHSGSVASTSNSNLTGGNSAGHTFIIQHVLANGDLIGCEENWPGKSGDDHGSPGPNRWDFFVYPKSIDSDTKYFLPSRSVRWSK